LAKANEGFWVLKNTTIVESPDNMISLVNDVAIFKKTMLLKVRRGPREQLQAIVGTGKPNLPDFSDDDSEDGEEKKR